MPNITLARNWANYKVNVPVGTVGNATIERYTLTAEEADAMNWKALMNGDERAPAFEGEYTGLNVNKVMVMSDIASEIIDHLPFIHQARGRVLLTGLGIGMCLQALLRKPEVEHVTVVEVRSDVLALVAGHYLALFGGERVSFVHANAFDWQPPAETRFDLCWHDIWPLAMGAYWPEHLLLRRHYRPYADYQDSWRADYMQRQWQTEVQSRTKVKMT